MLPTIMLQLSDFATFETELNSPNLLPDNATEPQVGFADLLGLSVNPLPESTLPAGLALPAGGKQLPLPAAADLPQQSGQVEPEVRVARQLPSTTAPPQGQLARDLALALQTSQPAVAPPVALSAATSTVAPLELQAVTVPVNPQAPTRAASDRLPTVGVGIAVAAEVTSRAVANPGGATALPAVIAPPVTVEQPLRRAEPKSATQRAETRLPGEAGLRPVEPAKPVTDRLAAAAADAGERLRFAPPQTAMIAGDLRPRVPEVVVPAAAAKSPIVTPLTVDTVQAPVTAATASTAPPLNQPLAEVPQANATLATRIDVPVRDSAWGEQLGQRLQLMASNRLQAAEIRLSPAELGPLRVQVAIEDGAANVTFQAQHAITREAIEQALPRLREMFAENGLQLNQADIGEQGVRHGGREQGTENRTTAREQADAAADPETDEGETGMTRRRDPDGLVDTFV